MRMKNTLAFILAGGAGTRLGVLTQKRAKPAVPFAGKYRIIDFVLSNCAHSGIMMWGPSRNTDLTHSTITSAPVSRGTWTGSDWAA